MPRGEARAGLGVSPATTFSREGLSTVLAEHVDFKCLRKTFNWKALFLFGGGGGSLCQRPRTVWRSPNSAVCRTILCLKEVQPLFVKFGRKREPEKSVKRQSVKFGLIRGCGVWDEVRFTSRWSLHPQLPTGRLCVKLPLCVRSLLQLPARPGHPAPGPGRHRSRGRAIQGGSPSKPRSLAA